MHYDRYILHWVIIKRWRAMDGQLRHASRQDMLSALEASMEGEGPRMSGIMVTYITRCPSPRNRAYNPKQPLPHGARSTTAAVYSFSKVGFVFFILDKSAALISSVWRLAEFQTAVYLKPVIELAQSAMIKSAKKEETYYPQHYDP